MVVEQLEVYSYQLQPFKTERKLKVKDYYPGPIYSEKWLHDAVNTNKGNFDKLGGEKVLSTKENYRSLEATDETKTKRLIINSKKKFTICEGVMMFQFISQNSR